MSFHSSAAPQAFRIPDRGFGLVELMVSISIMMLLSTIILTRHTAFSGAVLLRNQAYEVAFALRKAQLLAVSGNNSGATLATTTQQYGVYFDDDTAGNNQKYIIFHDLNVDGMWDPADDQMVGIPGTLDSRFKVREFTKEDGSPLTNTKHLTIFFRRPNFDAYFKNATGGNLTGPGYVDIAQVAAANSNDDVGAVRRIQVLSTGQISVTSYP